MPSLRLLNEFGRESVTLSLEPEKECACSCTYCFAALSSSTQWAGKNRDLNDPGTFEAAIQKCHTDYDPSNFLLYQLKNRYPVCYANGCEPFQNVVKAKSILKICDQFGIPLWVQTKGLNWRDVWDYLKPHAGNCSLAVSFPSPDDRMIKRFEPGTPKSNERRDLIATAAEAGFQVTLALAPFHEDWLEIDPVSFVGDMISLGVSSVFFDRLHLTRRQRINATDKAMVGLASKTEFMDWPEKCVRQYEEIYYLCRDSDVPIYAASHIPTLYGWPNTIPTVCPPGVFGRGHDFKYHDGFIHSILEESFLSSEHIDWYNPAERDWDDSLILTWADALNILITSPFADPNLDFNQFTYSSIRDLLAVKNLPVTWRSALQPAATMPEFFRAMWNNPSSSAFAWRHPWARWAAKHDGTPLCDSDGNLIMIFDPDWEGNAGDPRMIEGDLDRFRKFEKIPVDSPAEPQ